MLLSTQQETIVPQVSQSSQLSKNSLFRLSPSASLKIALALATLLFSSAHAAADPSDAPTINYFTAEFENGYLTVYGWVTDEQEDPNGWTVDITGSVTGTATVQPDGYFVFTTAYYGSYGIVEAEVEDPLLHKDYANAFFSEY